MTVELKRMYQRRGLKADLPQVPTDGEIYLTMDTEELFIGSNGNFIKTLTSNDTIDSLDSDSLLPLTAKQGSVLKDRLAVVETTNELLKEDVKNQIDGFGDTIQDLQNDNTQINQELQGIKSDLLNKQDILIFKGLTPPSVDYMWYDEN